MGVALTNSNPNCEIFLMKLNSGSILRSHLWPSSIKLSSSLLPVYFCEIYPPAQLLG